MNAIVDITTLPGVLSIVAMAQKKILKLTGVEVMVQINTGSPTEWDLKRAKLLKVVLDSFHVRRDQLFSNCRKPNIVNARHAYMYLCHSLLKDSFQTISDEFNKPGHTTAWHAHNKVKQVLEQQVKGCEELASHVEQIIKIYKGEAV